MEISEIKSRLTITEVLGHYGLKANQNNMLHCPFHNDKTPSLQIYPNTNTYCCFSSNCTAGTGDVIEFIRLMEKVNKHEAILKAASLISNHHTKNMLSPKNEIPPQAGDNTEAKFLSRQAVLTKYFQGSTDTLSHSKYGARARAYLKSRGLDHNNIGFATSSFERPWNSALIESATAIGLLKKKGDRHEPHFKECILFAMKDANGHVVDVYGRGIDKGHFYLPGNHQGLYPSYPKPETTKLILTEAIIDAATLLQEKNVAENFSVLACYGTNGFTEEHAQAIRELKQLEEVIIFFDGDGAGKEGSKKIADKLHQLSPEIKLSYTDTPEGEDVNSLLQSHEPEIFTHLLSTRKPFSFSTEKKETPDLTSHSSTEALAKVGLNTENPELLFYQNGVLNITVLGGIRITGLDKLRVTLKLESKIKDNTLPLRHNLDLYNKGQTDQLAAQAAEHFDIGTLEATHAIAGLINGLEGYRATKLEQMKPKKEERPTLSEVEKREALDYLKKEKLMHRTLQDIIKTGIVGEQINSMVAYLVYTSRKREKPKSFLG